MGDVGMSSAGYPYLEASRFRTLRDTLPLLFSGGQAVRDTVDVLAQAATQQLDGPLLENLLAAATVIRTILNTAAVTGPPDLWLIRQILHTWKTLDLLSPIFSQEGMAASQCGLLEHEIKIDLTFMLSRGYLTEKNGRYFTASHPAAIATIQSALTQTEKDSLPNTTPSDWASFFRQEAISPNTSNKLTQFLETPNIPTERREHWCGSWQEINLGYRWVPILLGMHQSSCAQKLAKGESIHEEVNLWKETSIGAPLIKLMLNVGVIQNEDQSLVPTSIGKRVFKRAAGPFGIIQAYQPYMENLPKILNEGMQKVHVQRGPNVAASQLANRTSFENANKSLDLFCENTGFSYSVYIEHALGRGEATRQRFEKAGDSLSYVGADLEQASIDSAQTEQQKGHLPKNMKFLSGADIGQPSILLDYLEAQDISPHHAIMVVGNGFHEVRGQTDERVIDIFRNYHDAGLLLLFTEESALSVADLLETAWNTYHAGFKYVHERSGQGLRPAQKGPEKPFGPMLPMSWHECASRAGYVPIEDYTTRTRTIFPYAPKSGFNPSISVNHFFIPENLASSLNLK